MQNELNRYEKAEGTKKRKTWSAISKGVTEQDAVIRFKGAWLDTNVEWPQQTSNMRDGNVRSVMRS